MSDNYATRVELLDSHLDNSDTNADAKLLVNSHENQSKLWIELSTILNDGDTKKRWDDYVDNNRKLRADLTDLRNHNEKMALIGYNNYRRGIYVRLFGLAMSVLTVAVIITFLVIYSK
jgi:hypothetical protein